MILEEHLHTVLLHKINQIKSISDRISELNHQIRYYKQMDKVFQKDVVQDLINDITDIQKNSPLNWNNMLKELKEIKEGLDKE